MMKKYTKYIAFVLLSCVLEMTSCTGNFESYNTDGAGFSDGLKEQEFNKYGLPLKVVQQGIYFNYDWGGGKNWTFQVMQNLGALLEKAGSGFDRVVKTTCFLADMGDFAAFNAIYGRYFTGRPARSCVAAKQLPKNVLVEVELIAEV